MKHYCSLDNLTIPNSMLTIGSFDGIHLGHQKLITELVKSARQGNVPAAVITFTPLPAVFLRNIKNPFYISTLEDKYQLLENLGVDILVTLDFNKELAEYSARDFMQLLNTYLGIRRLFVGQNFSLGRNKYGNIPTLIDLGKELNYSVEILDPVLINDEIVSSSLIRSSLLSGDIKKANQMLGRKFHVLGNVIKGDGRGYEIGYPTANIKISPNQLYPKNGVYITMVVYNDNKYISVTNVGNRPTFYKDLSHQTIETHILDFNADLYGQKIIIEFVDFIRPEMKFNAIQELKTQIDEDIKFTLRSVVDDK